MNGLRLGGEIPDRAAAEVCSLPDHLPRTKLPCQRYHAINFARIERTDQEVIPAEIQYLSPERFIREAVRDNQLWPVGMPIKRR